MNQYSIELRTRNYVKGYGFLSFARNFSNKYRKNLLDTGLVATKNATKIVVQKAAEATIEFIGNKIGNKIVKIKPITDYYSTRRRRRNIKQINKSITKMERYKISKLSDDSAVSKFVTKMDRSK